MKYDCEVIKDLLPLYNDELCSDATKAMVEEHLEECESCRQLNGKIEDNGIEEILAKEREDVLQKHKEHVNRKTTLVGITTAGILTIPIIVCLICNLAIGHALDWFFIVLTSMFLVASLIVVPLVVNKRKFVCTFVSFLGSLLLLLLTCCIYTKGDWFILVAVSCVFGLTVVFLPILINKIYLPEFLSQHKALLTILWDTIWLYLLLFVCGIYVGGGSVYWNISIVVTTYCMLLPWVYLIVIRYAKIRALSKAGILMIFTGLLGGFSCDILNHFLIHSTNSSLKYVDLSHGFCGANEKVINANVYLLEMVIAIVVGLALLFIDQVRGKNAE